MFRVQWRKSRISSSHSFESAGYANIVQMNAMQLSRSQSSLWMAAIGISVFFDADLWFNQLQFRI